MPPAPTPGYSGTPLAKKLGIKEGSRVLARSAPPDYRALLAPLPPRLVFQSRLSQQTDIVHLFATRRAQLLPELERCLKGMRRDAAIWVSWPKRSAKVPTDITEDVIREVALPLGLVDVKVCAVTDVWAGLRLVIRKELRG